MPINLLSTLVGPVITCNKPTVDGYCVTNLVTKSNGAPRKSFLAEAFIRPPLNITIQFPFPVSIDRIVLGSKVGNHRSMDFEIYSSCMPSKSPQAKVFQSIARGSDESKSLFVFKTSRFEEITIPMANALNQPSTKVFNPDATAYFQLWHRQNKFLDEVTDMTFTIKRVAPNSVCSVNFLEIWGLPSRSNPMSVFEQLAARLRECASMCIAPSDQEVEENPPSLIGPLNTRDHLVPPDFLDPITLEMMAYPIILPSGHTVDQQTLDRYNAEQALLFRSPSDPFTGQLLTPTHAPIPNTPLKLRIDAYLLQHPEIIVSNGRAVGAAVYDYHMPKESSLLASTSNKRSASDAELTPMQLDYDVPQCFSSYNNYPSEEYYSNNDSSHNKRLKLSLDAALNQAMLGSKFRDNLDELDSNMCQWCGNACFLYKMVCSHLACRNCIQGHTSNGSLTCSLCCKSSQTGEIIKVHL